MNIRIENLSKTYSANQKSIYAVNDVSLFIPENTVFGIIGKSGAGKSTLIRLMSLLEKPDSGKIFFGDERVDNLSEKQIREKHHEIGMIFQNFNLFSSRTAGGNVAYPLEICKTPKYEIESRTEELLSLVGLAERKSAPVSTLSGGQKQRVAIARALANNPRILFCDEATSALDPQTTHAILDLIRGLQKKMQLTVVMITHQMEVVRDACDYVAVLDDGKVSEEGKVSDVFLHPKSSVTKDFLMRLTPALSDAESGAGSERNNSLVRWSDAGGKYVLRFRDTLTDKAILSKMAQKFTVECNIRAGGIQKLIFGKIGTLIVDLTGDESEVKKAISFLENEGVVVEEGDA